MAGTLKWTPILPGIRLTAQWLNLPLGWEEPHVILVCPRGDLFHEDIPDEWIDKVFARMAVCPQHTFQVVTKQVERIKKYCAKMPPNLATEVLMLARHDANGYPIAGPCTWPLPNVWITHDRR